MYLPVLSSFSLLTCLLLLMPLRASRMDESFQQKKLFKPSVCNMLVSLRLSTICHSAYLGARCVLVYRFLQPVCLQVFLFCLLVYVPASIRLVLLITPLLVC